MSTDPSVIDLFSGAGGLSLGFQQAGFEIAAGVDVEERFVGTFSRNHDGEKGIQADLTDVTGSDLLEEVDRDRVEGVVGGPPCQGFSLAGRRQADDERNNLVFHFIRLVDEIDPDFFLMENVGGITSMATTDGRDVVEEILGRVPPRYETRTFVLNSVEYGTPQLRRRFFLAGVKNGSAINRPEPTHGPAVGLFREQGVTVEDALGDLPAPTSEEPQEYNGGPTNDFQEYLRAGSTKLYNHTPTNHRQSTIEKMQDQEQGTSLYDSYTDSWYRLVPNEPAPTVKENHNAPFVHPHEDRVTTPRECARLQGFPDNFVFEGPKSAQLVQIGNAVPPQFGQAWGRTFMHLFE